MLGQIILNPELNTYRALQVKAISKLLQPIWKAIQLF